ncbi:hypothetical protein [Streptomyces sp. NPDC056525]|uniref:hypothetical protein n=1 Tax=unclassified Streptomyces TaxID=2593676 RepID=UPI0036C200F7
MAAVASVAAPAPLAALPAHHAVVREGVVRGSRLPPGEEGAAASRAAGSAPSPLGTTAPVASGAATSAGASHTPRGPFPEALPASPCATADGAQAALAAHGPGTAASAGAGLYGVVLPPHSGEGQVSARMDPAAARAATDAALAATAGRSALAALASGPAGTTRSPAARRDRDSTVAPRPTASALRATATGGPRSAGPSESPCGLVPHDLSTRRVERLAAPDTAAASAASGTARATGPGVAAFSSRASLATRTAEASPVPPCPSETPAARRVAGSAPAAVATDGPVAAGRGRRPDDRPGAVDTSS